MPLLTSQDSRLTEDQVKKIVKETLREISERRIDHQGKISVFISHKFTTRDIGFAAKLGAKLNGYGIESYLAEHKKEYGYIISQKIKDAIQNSICVIIILTKDSIPSPSVNQELGYAMGIGMNIIPMVHEEVSGTVGVLLNGVEGEEFNEKNFDEKCDRIAKHIVDKLQQYISPEANESDQERFRKERGDYF